MVVLAVDVGTVRVGAAWGDSSVKIAFPLAVWPKAQGGAERELLKVIAERRPELLVVGLPLGPSGERTATCEIVEGFVRRLVKRAPIRIEYIDEAFSSHDALERLRSAGAERTQLDAFAACLILERYFEKLSG
ncbi:MAG: Holliday junction resolvase RuvX [Pseudomonadota bacterium]|jgi:putative Holliday junction resolvase